MNTGSNNTGTGSGLLGRLEQLAGGGHHTSGQGTAGLGGGNAPGGPGVGSGTGAGLGGGGGLFSGHHGQQGQQDMQGQQTMQGQQSQHGGALHAAEAALLSGGAGIMGHKHGGNHGQPGGTAGLGAGSGLGGVRATVMQATGMGPGTGTGAGAGSHTQAMRPSAGQRVLGQAEILAGEILGKPAMVLKGEEKKTGVPVGAVGGTGMQGTGVGNTGTTGGHF